jgi:DNA polymerase III gamma/tau subunit
MAKLLINSQTRTMIDRYLSDPAHALLLVGEMGVGLGTIAQYIAEQLTAAAYISRVSPEGSTISIDEIRPLYARTKTKQADRQVIIIDDADTMRHEAQNALLKLLEEPSSEVFFVLTTHHDQLLLGTIHSRIQKIRARPITLRESQEFVASLAIEDETKARQILFIAGGRPAEIARLSQDEKYFEAQSTKATDARTFLGADSYDRLKVATKYNSREDALEFLEMLGRLAVHMLYRQPDSHYSKRLEAIADAVERIGGNGHVRTQLTRLVVQWS